jgi:predicted amidophosphoribosyltransferase
VFRAALALIAPPLCATCGGSAEPHAILCPTCETELGKGHGVHLAVSLTDACWAARPYTGTARDLVAGLKFSTRLKLAERAAQLIAAEIPPSLLAGELVPVPASPLRRMWRGFDPAAEIATKLSRLTNLPVATCLRRSNGPRQVGRERTARLAQPPRVRAHAPVPIAALVIDDVTTTGATISACAAALRAAGSITVAAAAFAATPDRASALGTAAQEA